MYLLDTEFRCKLPRQIKPFLMLLTCFLIELSKSMVSQALWDT